MTGKVKMSRGISDVTVLSPECLCCTLVASVPWLCQLVDCCVNVYMCESQVVSSTR